jgi:hypothetical protein
MIKILKSKSIFKDLSNTYVITGMPRGGTTWMAEVLNTVSNSLYLHEPLKKGRIEAFQKIDFDWNQFIPENASWREAEFLFQKLFKGQVLNPALIERTANMDNLLSTRKLVLKFVRLNRMLPWIVNHFPDLNLPMFIIRHPCAVIYSQMNHGAWNYVNQLQFPYKWCGPASKFNEFYNVIQKKLPAVRSIEQHLAIAWCLDTLPLFHQYNDKKWITISYEKAVLNKESILREIFDRLDLKISDQTLYKLTSPSSSTQKLNPLEHSGQKQIAKWQSYFSKNKLEQINEILKIFEIDFYSVRDIEPDYQKIAGLNQSSFFSEALKAVEYIPEN